MKTRDKAMQASLERRTRARVTHLALAQLVDAVKRQYPSYKLSCSPEVVKAIADAEFVLASNRELEQTQ